MKIYIHLGPPKTASTFLQKKIFPNINEIFYFGKMVDKKNDSLFLKLFDYVIGTNQSKRLYYGKNKKNLEKLQLDIKNFIFQTDEKILISAEDFLQNFSPSYFEITLFGYPVFRKMSFIKSAKLNKIQRLINFFKEINIDLKFLIFERKAKNRITGMFETHFDRMRHLDKKINLNKYLRSYLNEPNEIEKYFFNQFIYVDTINYIKENNKDINIISYELLKENKYLFINKIFNFLELKELNKKEIDTSFNFEKINQTPKDTDYIYITNKKNDIIHFLSSIYNYNPAIKKFLKMIIKSFKTNKVISENIDIPLLKEVSKKIDIENN